MAIGYTIDASGGRFTLRGRDGRPFRSLGVDCVTPDEHDVPRLVLPAGGRNPAMAWGERMWELLRSAGFNTLGAWHAPVYWETDHPKTIEIRMSRTAAKVNTVWGMGFPDVFCPSFETSAHRACFAVFGGAGRRLPESDTLIGYYTDNELHWWGPTGYWGNDDRRDLGSCTEIVDDYIRLSAGRPGKRRWVAYLRDRHHTIRALNETWGSEYGDFDDLEHLEYYRADRSALQADKLDFLRLIAERYFEVTHGALRRYDTGHLNLGCRFAGTTTPDVVLEVMGRYVDAVSVNFYEMSLPVEHLTRIHALSGKPVMITEFSYCAGSQAGFTRITNGAQGVVVRDQARRGECYDGFVRAAFALPYLLGTHWFALHDYGNRDGLIGNYGLLDLEGRPYVSFLEAVARTNGGVLGT